MLIRSTLQHSLERVQDRHQQVQRVLLNEIVLLTEFPAHNVYILTDDQLLHQRYGADL